MTVEHYDSPACDCVPRDQHEQLLAARHEDMGHLMAARAEIERLRAARESDRELADRLIKFANDDTERLRAEVDQWKQAYHRGHEGAWLVACSVCQTQVG